MNGVNGASSVATVTRHSYSVGNAAIESCLALARGSQNRRRQRRTYQFDRSSTKRWIRRPAAVAS